MADHYAYILPIGHQYVGVPMDAVDDDYTYILPIGQQNVGVAPVVD